MRARPPPGVPTLSFGRGVGESRQPAITLLHCGDCPQMTERSLVGSVKARVSAFRILTSALRPRLTGSSERVGICDGHRSGPLEH